MSRFYGVKETQRAEEVKLVDTHCVLGLVGFWVVKEGAEEKGGSNWDLMG